MAEQQPPNLPIIGWREWVKLPSLGVEAIKVKVDTGARSSALHAFELEEFVADDGRPMVRFKLHPFQRDLTTVVECVTPLVDRRQVRSSHGHETLRPVIITTLEMAGRQCEIEVTLAARDAMGFRMLLGREAIRRRFVVDPGRSYVTGRRRAPKKRKKKRQSP